MNWLFQKKWKLRSNLISLTYTSPFHKYTFLQSNFFCINQTKSKVRSTKIDQFHQKIYSQIPSLLQLEEFDFNEQNLTKIEQKNFKDTLLLDHKWRENQQKIYDLKVVYDQMQNQLFHNINQNNLQDSIQTLFKFNCIDLKIWSKVITFISALYKKSSLESRIIFMKTMNEYLKKFQHNYDPILRYAFKFMIPLSYMKDLVQFRSFFKLTTSKDNFISPNDPPELQQMKLQLLENEIHVIFKITRLVDPNTYQIKQYLNQRMKEMIMIASQYKKSPIHERLLFKIYNFYTDFQFENANFFQEIEKHYYQRLRQKFYQRKLVKPQDQSLKPMLKQLNYLLSRWKKNGRCNMEFYNQIIKPSIESETINEQFHQPQYYAILAKNLLCCGIDDDCLTKLISIMDQLQIKDNSYGHVVKHYLNIVSSKQIYQSSYTGCFVNSNPKIFKFLSDNNKTIYSTCLKKQNSNRKVINYKEYKEYFKRQEFWKRVLNKIFKNKFQVIQNAHFCVYQIDYLVLTKKKMIAFEIQGAHYNFYQVWNSQKTSEVKSIGTKQQKKFILKAYDIEIVKIICLSRIVIYILQSRSQELAALYILKILKEQHGIQIQNL